MTVKRSIRIAALAALPAVFALCAASPALAADSQAFQIDLEQLNDSGGSGTAMLSINGSQLTVKIESEGLVPGQPHAQHIHGSTQGHNFHCPPASADKDGDGIVSTGEGIPHYGDINISLTTKGDTSKESGLAIDRMPTADANGKVSYERTITVSKAVATHIQDLHVVQHGIDPNKNKEYDFGKGKSELDPKLPQEATAPAVCGIVKGASVGAMPVGGVETGSGSPEGIADTPALAIGGTALLASAGAFAAMRLRTRQSR
ncbi:hypothetical protein [Streptomyces sp. H27-D2]|uniref:hypothetical protein n=1 Tax=Streptomyces sp. H27-D2 TaxID=3046304 RepID=UPI002DB9B42D|nr:hypothetical protein [Streptomyces sp. H27-D2]MEC4015310.1 hypothetical protein [Streptomyces sp. H27-D2]